MAVLSLDASMDADFLRHGWLAEGSLHALAKLHVMAAGVRRKSFGIAMHSRAAGFQFAVFDPLTSFHSAVDGMPAVCKQGEYTGLGTVHSDLATRFSTSFHSAPRVIHAKRVRATHRKIT